MNAKEQKAYNQGYNDAINAAIKFLEHYQLTTGDGHTKEFHFGWDTAVGAASCGLRYKLKKD